MAKKKFNFEESLDNLEKIVGELESGDLTLENSLERFESGIKLYTDCRKFIDDTEKKVKKLTDSLKEMDI